MNSINLVVVPLKKILSFLQILRPAYEANSDQNVNLVHGFITWVMEKIFRGCEKNRIINTHNLIYKPTNALNKINKIQNIQYNSRLT